MFWTQKLKNIILFLAAAIALISGAVCYARHFHRSAAKPDSVMPEIQALQRVQAEEDTAYRANAEQKADTDSERAA